MNCPSGVHWSTMTDSFLTTSGLSDPLTTSFTNTPHGPARAEVNARWRSSGDHDGSESTPGSVVSRDRMPVVGSTSHKSQFQWTSGLAGRTTVGRPRGDKTTCVY